MQQPAFTVTASHPLVWCLRDGTTVRCVTVAESALLMGFPPGWQLPQGSRAGLRAVGNAVPPPLAQAVMLAAVATAAAAAREAAEGAAAAAVAAPEAAAEDTPASAATLGEATLGASLAALQRSVRRLRRGTQARVAHSASVAAPYTVAATPRRRRARRASRTCSRRAGRAVSQAFTRVPPMLRCDHPRIRACPTPFGGLPATR